jgi:hypothetical protein
VAGHRVRHLIFFEQIAFYHFESLDEKEARDLFWTLTARDIYRMLVIERKWSSDRYEKWLSEAIVSALVIQKRV